MLTVLGNYKAERTVENFLLIHDVEISKETSKKDRPDFVRDLDVGTFNQFIKHYDRRVQQGKVGAFVLLEHEGPGVGRILNLRVENKQLVADLLVTNEDVIGMIERGELTERSIEWGWNEKDARLKGVALLAGKFGQDSEGWPDLTVTYTKESIEADFAAENFSEFSCKSLAFTSTLAGVHATHLQKESDMALTPEDIKALTDGLKPVIEQIVDAKMQTVAKASDEPVNTKKVDEALSRIQKKERDLTIKGFVDTLARKGYSNKKHLTATFEKFGDNLQAMEVEYKRLMEKADEDVKLEMEETYEQPTLDDELSTSYKEFCAAYPEAKVSEREFKAVCKGEHRADFGNKPINYLPGSIKLA
ncbi:MAG: hypothetical protein M5U25_21175 [Planctomycetota bacterium]|nr:hypothetical protein [Planctomycetota bacterium]